MYRRTVSLLMIIIGVIVFIFPRAFTEYRDYSYKNDKKNILRLFQI